MARPLGDHPGGIARLDGLIEAYPNEIKSELIDRGLRLRDLCEVDDFNWDDLRAIVACVRPESALARAIQGKDWPWGLQEMLLADIGDTLRWLQWAKTKDGQKNRNPPKQTPRPGVKAPERIGDAPVSVAEMNKFLGWKVA